MKASPQGYLIMVKICAGVDAVEVSYFPERLEIRPRPQIIAHYFKTLGKRSEKFALAET